MANTSETRRTGLWNVIKSTIASHKLLTFGLAGAVVGSVLLALLPPLVMEQLVNHLVGGQGVTLGAALLYFAVLALAGLFDAGKEMLITVFGQKITHGLRSALCAKLSRLPTAYFSKHEAGSVTSRMVNDVDTVEALFASGIISMVADACKIIGIIAVIFTRSTGLGVLILLAAPLLYAMTRLFQTRMLRAQRDNRAAVARVNQYIPETIANIRTIHCLGKESYREQQYDRKIQASYRAVEKANLYNSIYSPIVALASTVILATVMVLSAMGGGMQVFFGMSVGTAVAVMAYVGQVFGPIENIGMEIQNIQSAVAGVTRINELLREPEQPPTDRSLTADALLAERAQGIRFEGVTFAYDAADAPVLTGFDLQLQPGEAVTLAGRTGAGKSTIFKLLLGLYSPGQGSVRVFGAEAAAIPSAEKRRLFGTVPQAFHRVPGTIAEQITLYEPEITPDAVERAVRLVGLHETIEALPDGYQTDCAAAAFSQGQLQLLSIARAVVADPPILLLDEITANLDTLTEHAVLTALDRAAQGRTVISISHRLYENGGSRVVMI